MASHPHRQRLAGRDGYDGVTGHARPSRVTSDVPTTATWAAEENRQGRTPGRGLDGGRRLDVPDQAVGDAQRVGVGGAGDVALRVRPPQPAPVLHQGQAARRPRPRRCAPASDRRGRTGPGGDRPCCGPTGRRAADGRRRRTAAESRAGSRDRTAGPRCGPPGATRPVTSGGRCRANPPARATDPPGTAGRGVGRLGTAASVGREPDQIGETGGEPDEGDLEIGRGEEVDDL